MSRVFQEFWFWNKMHIQHKYSFFFLLAEQFFFVCSAKCEWTKKKQKKKYSYKRERYLQELPQRRSLSPNFSCSARNQDLVWSVLKTIAPNISREVYLFGIAQGDSPIIMRNLLFLELLNDSSSNSDPSIFRSDGEFSHLGLFSVLVQKRLLLQIFEFEIWVEAAFREEAAVSRENFFFPSLRKPKPLWYLSVENVEGNPHRIEILDLYSFGKGCRNKPQPICPVLEGWFCFSCEFFVLGWFGIKYRKLFLWNVELTKCDTKHYSTSRRMALFFLRTKMDIRETRDMGF